MVRLHAKNKSLAEVVINEEESDEQRLEVLTTRSKLLLFPDLEVSLTMQSQSSSKSLGLSGSILRGLHISESCRLEAQTVHHDICGLRRPEGGYSNMRLKTGAARSSS